MSKAPGRNWPNWPDWDDDPLSGASERTVPQEAAIGERADMVIYGPDGAVLRLIEDRPFLGYRGAGR